jgi:hypothetical protein
MAAPKDEKSDAQTEHLENLAKMLREIEENLSDHEAKVPPEPPLAGEGPA